MDELLIAQKENLGIDNFLENAKVYVEDLNLNINLDKLYQEALKSGNIIDGLKQIDIRSIFLKEVSSILSTIALILVVIIINAILKSIIDSLNNSSASKNIYFIQYLVIASIIIKTFMPVLEITKEAINSCVGFMNILLPILLVMMLSTGNIVTKSVVEPVLLVMMNFIGKFINNFCIPVLLISFVISLVSNLTTKVKVDKISKLLKSIILWTLGIVLTFFTVTLSLETTITESVDDLASKTTKAAVSNFIPVVGKIMGDTVETVIGSINVLKNVVGVIGTIIILLIVLLPSIRIMICWFMFKVVSAVAGPCSDENISNLLESIADSYKIMLGLLCTVSIMFIIGITIVINITSMSVG